MKVAFDTSVLVPALVAAHPNHLRSLHWLEAVVAGEIEGVASLHAAAETWSVLTRLPLTPAVSPETARRVLERLGQQLVWLAPDEGIYSVAIERCAARGLTSGAVFDALHMATAEAARADALLTYNRGDFTRLKEDVSPVVLVPPDPPRVLTDIS